MSLVMNIFDALWNATIYYKGGWGVNLFGVPRLRKRNYASLRSSIYRLRKNGYIEKVNDGWRLTKVGRKYYKNKSLSFKKFVSNFNEESPKNLLLMFDVPYEKKGHRDWLRGQLKKFGYAMVQKSVWVGPSPLPKEFIDYIKEIGIKDCIKTFKLARNYTL